MENTKKLNPSKIKMSKKKVYLFLIIGSLLLSISSFYFILAAQLYTPGLGGIANGITYSIIALLRNTVGLEHPSAFKTIVYWSIYGLFNLPIIYLTIKWYSKRFFTLSIFSLFLSLSFTMFLTFTPGFNVSLMPDKVFFNLDASLRMIIVLFLSLIAGIIYGVGVGLTFKIGGCTMGLDPIMRHLSRDKDKNIAPYLFFFGVSNSLFWIFVLYVINASFYDPNAISLDYSKAPVIRWTWNSFIDNTILSPSFFGSWLFFGTYSLVTTFIYSTNKKGQILITTEKTKEISSYLNETNFHRGHTLIETEGGYSGKKSKALQMIINMEEMYDVIEIIAAIDDHAFITVTELKRVYDVHNWIPMTNEDKEKQKEILKNEEKRTTNRNKRKEEKELKKTNKKS